ncbi:MAG: 4Fe-4S binding protein [Oscillospiraceae bacterium]
MGNKSEVADPDNKALRVNINRCPQNHFCPAVRVCPVGAISQKGFSAPKVDMEKCIRCGKCVRFCPMRALSLS